MMNALALLLVFASLASAGFFTTEKQNSKGNVIVKEGHRVVVVEFEKDDGNTKVSISPQDIQPPNKIDLEKGAKDVRSNAKEKMKDAASSVVPDVDSSDHEEEIHRRLSPKELVCDAYGKCKEKIASAVGKVQDGISDTAHKASEKAEEAKENIKDSASEVSTKAKDKIVDKAADFKEGAKKMKEEAEKESSKKMEGAKERVKETGEMVGRKERELGEILRRAGEVVKDIFKYMVSIERLASIAGPLHLLGFAAAYGMCVWVTFASSYVLAGALPRHQFGLVQSKIYPVYFKAMAYCVGMALLGNLMSTDRNRFSVLRVGGMSSGLNLLSSLAMILVNLLYLEPRATKVMFERMKKEKEEGRGKESDATEAAPTAAAVAGSRPQTAGRATATTAAQEKPRQKQEEAAAKSQLMQLSEKLRRLNSYSSFLNVLTLMCLTWHLFHLSQRLQSTVC